MMKNQLDLYVRMLNNNNAILVLYKQLADLEFFNEKGSDKYIHTTKIIKQLSDTNERLYHEYAKSNKAILDLPSLSNKKEASAYAFVYNFSKSNKTNQVLRYINFNSKENDEDYLLYKKLINSTILDYIDIEIQKRKSKVIKRELINVKYTFIALNKDLENVFLQDYNNYSKTSLYQQEFNENINNEKTINYVNKSISDNIKDTLIKIAKRKKDNYENYSDAIVDILLSIYLKAYTSLLTNTDDFNRIKSISEEITNRISNDLNKKLIKNSLNLELELILSRKL